MSSLFKSPKVPQPPSPFEQAQAQLITQFTPQGDLIAGSIDADGNFVQNTGSNASAVRVNETDFQRQFREGQQGAALGLLANLAPQLSGYRPLDNNNAGPRTMNEFRANRPDLMGADEVASMLPSILGIDTVGRDLTALDEDFAGRAGELADARFESISRRLTPEFDRSRERLEQSLANQGITVGSKAYEDSINRFEQQKGDTLTQLGLESEAAGSAEQDRLARLALTTRGQQFGEQAAKFDLSRTLRDQLLGEGLSLASLTSQNRGQMFGEALQEKQSALQKQLALSDLAMRQRAQQFSEIGALAGIGGGFNPVVGNAAISPVTPNAGPDRFGQLAQLGGQLGAAAIPLLSDRRLKEKIEHVGQQNGHHIYEFNYRGLPTRYRGVMAQDVQKTHPDAIRKDSDGYLMVDYSKLGVEMEVVHG